MTEDFIEHEPNTELSIDRQLVVGRLQELGVEVEPEDFEGMDDNDVMGAIVGYALTHGIDMDDILPQVTPIESRKRDDGMELAMQNDKKQTLWMIEQAVPEDAEAVALLHSESFKVAYLRPGDDEHNKKVIKEATAFVTSKRIRQRMKLILKSMVESNEEFYRIATNDDAKPIGLICGFKTHEKQEVLALYVDKDYYGAGVGQALMESFIEWADPARPIELGVVHGNERAARFYSKMGFQALGDDRESYYPFLPETTMIRPSNNQKEEK